MTLEEFNKYICEIDTLKYNQYTIDIINEFYSILNDEDNNEFYLLCSIEGLNYDLSTVLEIIDKDIIDFPLLYDLEKTTSELIYNLKICQ